MINKESEDDIPEIKVGRKLTLHSLEDGILSGCLSPASQRFGRGAAECCRDNAGDVILDSDSKRADELRDKVQRVRCHRRFGDIGAVLKRDCSALDECLTQLSKNLLVPVLTEPHHLRRQRKLTSHLFVVILYQIPEELLRMKIILLAHSYI